MMKTTHPGAAGAFPPDPVRQMMSIRLKKIDSRKEGEDTILAVPARPFPTVQLRDLLSQEVGLDDGGIDRILREIEIESAMQLIRERMR
jgi:hypothetical protein